MKKLLKNKKGFTLVELIIVLAILGIIAAIAVPKFKNIQESSKRKADVVTARMIAKATELAVAEDKIELPDSGTDTVTLSTLSTEGYLDTSSITPQSDTDAEFTVSVDSDGKIKVELDKDTGTDITLYPTISDSDYK